MRKRVVGLEWYRLRRFFPVWGSSIAVVGPLPDSLSRLSQLCVVNCRCGFLNRRGRPIVCIIISSRSTIRICILRRDDRFCFIGSYSSKFSVSFVEDIWRLWIRFWIVFA